MPHSRREGAPAVKRRRECDGGRDPPAGADAPFAPGGSPRCHAAARMRWRTQPPAGADAPFAPRKSPRWSRCPIRAERAPPLSSGGANAMADASPTGIRAPCSRMGLPCLAPVRHSRHARTAPPKTPAGADAHSHQEGAPAGADAPFAPRGSPPLSSGGANAMADASPTGIRVPMLTHGSSGDTHGIRQIPLTLGDGEAIRASWPEWGVSSFQGWRTM